MIKFVYLPNLEMAEGSLDQQNNEQVPNYCDKLTSYVIIETIVISLSTWNCSYWDHLKDVPINNGFTSSQIDAFASKIGFEHVGEHCQSFTRQDGKKLLYIDHYKVAIFKEDGPRHHLKLGLSRELRSHLSSTDFVIVPVYIQPDNRQDPPHIGLFTIKITKAERKIESVWYFDSMIVKKEALELYPEYKHICTHGKSAIGQLFGQKNFTIKWCPYTEDNP